MKAAWTVAVPDIGLVGMPLEMARHLEAMGLVDGGEYRWWDDPATGRVVAGNEATRDLGTWLALTASDPARAFALHRERHPDLYPPPR